MAEVLTQEHDGFDIRMVDDGPVKQEPGLDVKPVLEIPEQPLSLSSPGEAETSTRRLK